jgi:hypothetical protein
MHAHTPCSVSTEDSDVNIQALCDAILKELGFFSPAMMYTIGSSVVRVRGTTHAHPSIHRSPGAAAT